MATAAPLDPTYERPDEPNISHIETEDDAPVDNLFSERQQRLLVEPLYTSWAGPPPDEDGQPRRFMAAANVGVFSSTTEPPVVPDVFVSLDTAPRAPSTDKRNRSYFVWEHGKAPDLAIEVVSNREGNELGEKRRRYARMGIEHYVIFDPLHCLGETTLSAFELGSGRRYHPIKPWFEELGLGLVEWEGVYEDMAERWIRWRTRDGALLPTGAEHAALARQAEARADDAEARAARLAERLRALGVDPDEGPR